MVRKLDIETVGTLLEFQFGVAAQEGYALDGFGTSDSGQRENRRYP
jgi:hypothetical protein